MQSLQLTAHVAADGMLHIPAPQFAGQDVEIIVLPVPRNPQADTTLIGAEALKIALEVGFIGSLDAEPEFSTRYKEELDWTDKI